MPQKGDYVLATKYYDGDPQDQWCSGGARRIGVFHAKKKNIEIYLARAACLLDGEEEDEMSDPKYQDIGDPIIRAIEECSELTKALCKVSRFGWFNSHPDRPESSNLEDVMLEIEDVRGALERLEAHIDHLSRASNVMDTVGQGG